MFQKSGESRHAPTTAQGMKSTSVDPLLQAWESTRSYNGSAIFDTKGESLRTFPEIEEESQGFTRDLERVAKPGDVIAIQTGNHPSWPALFLACLRNRLVALPLERILTDRERDGALRICRAAAIVEVTNPSTFLATRPGVAFHQKSESISIRSLTHEAIDWRPNPPVLLKLTSGTTAAPRAIRFRSTQLLADCDQICETMGIRRDDLNFAVIPVSHSYGFSNLITPLLARGVPMVLSRDRMPRAVLDDLARSNATVFPGMPVFYQAFSEMANVPALPKLRLCLSAGAPLPLEIAKKFQTRFRLPIHSFYGSSECGGICYDREARLIEPGFVGQPMNGVTLDQLEPNASATRVRVRTAAAGDGYFPEPDEEKLGNGQFSPDDLLTPSPDGFRIVGRVSDLINVAGKKVNPAEVEAELLLFTGVREAVAFGRESSRRNEEVAACVVAGADIRESDLLDYCRKRLSGWQVPKQIYVVEAIPTNERGKISRRELAARFHS
jgi:long-chain acyl-CoA synthetase